MGSYPTLRGLGAGATLSTRMTLQKWAEEHALALCLLLVTVLSYFTYFHNYTYPDAPYWDENYYITDAQREMNGVFYMQIHPPLGKLLLAAGEIIADGNKEDDLFLDTEHQGEFPEDFSFEGYRLFPALLSWLAAPLLFLIFFFIIRNPLSATFLTFFYIFDNAMIVHNRGAQLDGPMTFFSVLTILAFFLLIEYHNKKKWFALLSAFFGISYALTFTTKFQGAIFVLLALAFVFFIRKDLNKIGKFILWSVLGFAVTFIGVWHLHFSLLDTVNPALSNAGYFETSDAYKKILQNNTQANILNFPVMLRDSLAYVPHYNKGIPKLDLCKSDENGSPFFLWPIGATTINYRWETTDSGETYRYLYLVPNPAIWWGALAAVILSIVVMLGMVFYPSVIQDKKIYFLTLVFLGLYVSYMITMARMDRVLFLYSYFTPLLFAIILVGLVAASIKKIGPWVIDEQMKTSGLAILGIVVFMSFQFFRAFTYYEPLTDAQVQRRSLLRIWQIKCVQCEKDSPLVRNQC